MRLLPQPATVTVRRADRQSISLKPHICCGSPSDAPRPAAYFPRPLRGHIKDDTGGIRDTIFLNQTRVRNQVTSSTISDFQTCSRTFETDGKSKDRKQISSAEEDYIVKDGIGFSSGNILPL